MVVVLAFPTAVARDILPAVASALRDDAMVISVLGPAIDSLYLERELGHASVMALEFPDPAHADRVLHAIKDERPGEDELWHVEARLWDRVGTDALLRGKIAECAALLIAHEATALVGALARFGARFGLSLAVAHTVAISALHGPPR
jgi:hypothetical protein